MEHDSKAGKGKRMAYWIITGFLAMAMIGGGFAQFIQAKVNADGFIRLGYPLYSMKLIGLWKMAGGLMLVIPGYRLVKEWAYAGFFFLLTGAVSSHIASGDAFYQWVASFVFAILTVLSWYLRPANRRLQTTHEKAVEETVY
ncbi:hypothetical protein FAES_4667 [Fibrella aestuarina BUZ 2]|uniref:DoxX family protein n=1 Tax=Fibrella aestuarina BUZ 2 TaxID=1166018 RepID=I0KEW3_9BACT|nr:DoxX family protein [Fibrella aestuarina]CCH02666.1 hypothetical protein FAES_4667 [Fibrella aestuarina BUZ 2]